MIARSVARCDEMFGARDEVGECVPLLEQPAMIVPELAHLGSAADVCDGEDDPSIDQAQAIGRKPWIDAVAVRAVTIEQQGTHPIELEALAIDQRNRHLDSIWSLCEDPLGLIL